MKRVHPLRRGDPRPAGDVVKSLLRGVRVVDSALQDTLLAEARKHWPGIADEDCHVASFQRGRMHVIVDTHARLAEARGFVAEAIRTGMNVAFAADRRSPKGRHVTRIDFHLRGTYS